VVGSRALTRYGREACTDLISGLAGYPISIVSGLALGADTCAHLAALEAGLHTVAIPGSGLSMDYIYPRANESLARNILDAGGALISEHPPDYKSHPHDFPSRNRLMVGMADAVLLIEAGSKSGTLITARMAADYNRDLLAIPHRIGDVHSEGVHVFLRAGAALVTEPLHILEALHITPRSELVEGTEFGSRDGVSDFRIDHSKFTESELLVYLLLSEPCTRDELLRVSTLSSSETLSVLGLLELKGVVAERYGLWRRAI
jgi:DNA processing protein